MQQFSKKLHSMTNVFLTFMVVLLFVLTTATSAYAEDGDAGTGELTADTIRMQLKAPPDFVFEYLTVEDKIALWNTDKGVKVSFPNGIEPRVGKQIRVEIKAPFRPWLLMEIRTLEPGKLVKTEFIDGALKGSFYYILQEDGAGTIFLHKMEIEGRSGLTKFIWDLFGRKIHKRKMSRLMDNMKEIVEKDWKAMNGESEDEKPVRMITPELLP